MSESSSLKQSILSAVCFFDIFDYPLTLFELWKWQYNKNYESRIMNQGIKISDILEILDGERLKKVVEQKNGFYFLRGREKIIQTRYRRAKLAEAKFKKALKVGKLLSLVPFVRMIGVCNDLAYNNAPEDSDIDLFIVTKPGRIWMARFFCVLLLKLLRARPTPKEKKDKICLSFFVTQDNLNLESIALKPASSPLGLQPEGSALKGAAQREDIYLVYWICQLVPIYDEKKTYDKFLEANQWIKKFLPNALSGQPAPKKIRHSWFWRMKKRSWEWLSSEKFYRWFQLKILPEELKKNTAVIVSDEMLKFHKIDKREYFQRKFKEKLKWVLTP